MEEDNDINKSVNNCSSWMDSYEILAAHDLGFTLRNSALEPT